MTRDPQLATPTPATGSRGLRLVRRVPYTLGFLLGWLGVGLGTGTFFTAAIDRPWYPDIAIGVPSLVEGRWWTIVTSAFFVERPVHAAILGPLVLLGVGWAEWRFGTARTVAIFWASHAVGMLGATAASALLSGTGWPFAVADASTLDVGASCAALGALCFAIATLPSPWRLRARIAMTLFVAISVLYFGTFADVAHGIVSIVALVASALLPRLRRPGGRPTELEWRTLAFAGLIAIGVIEVIDLLVPHDGPLGENYPLVSTLVVLLDLVAIALLAHGILRGYRVAWWVCLGYGVASAAAAVVAVVLERQLLSLGVVETRVDIFGMFVAPGALWLGLVVLLVAARGAFRVHLRQSRRSFTGATVGRDTAIELVREHGGGPISWMTTWADNSRNRFADGFIAYQVHGGVAIALGDPIVSAGRQGEALEEFARQAQRAGLIPCAFSVGPETMAARPPHWRETLVAEDMLVDLPGLEFRGKSWGDVRTAINRAKREGIAFRLTTLAEEPWRILAQVRAISEQWAGDKGLPEMRFTLGTVAEALDPSVRVALAVDDDGNLHGVLSWLPVYGGDDRIVGWTLDLMRRRDGGFPTVIEFLIGASAQHFAEHGYDFLSLSGAPLVFPPDHEADPVESVLKRLSIRLEPLYGFASLHRFKQKFNPRAAPMYLLYRDEGDLPRIGVALTRAYLPGVSLPELIRSARPAAEPATQA